MTYEQLRALADLLVDDPRYVGWQVELARWLVAFDDAHGKALK